jgi:hypothetical protein
VEGFRTTLRARLIRTDLSLHISKTLVARILAYSSAFIFNFDNVKVTLLTGAILSTTGRGYPDISAQATHFQIVHAGKVKGVSGTSCSSPVHFPLIDSWSSSRRA